MGLSSDKRKLQNEPRGLKVAVGSVSTFGDHPDSIFSFLKQIASAGVDGAHPQIPVLASGTPE